MTRNPSRPLSPHLTVTRFGPHMLVSIIHRLTGAGVSIVGGALLVWWLASLAGGRDAYALFGDWLDEKWVVGILVLLSLGLIQHALSGLRHMVLDVGAGFEIQANRMWALLTFAGSALLTAALWYYILGVR